jgi:hypothetical protein
MMRCFQYILKRPRIVVSEVADEEDGKKKDSF